MSPGKNGNKPGGMSMLQAALLNRIEQHGANQQGYADHLGVSKTGLSRWLKQDISPLHIASTAEKVSRDLELSPEALYVLREVSVQEACEIVLKAKAAEDPAEQDVQERFFGLMVENGAAIPPAAYLIYLTGDLESRQSMVSLLENRRPE